MSFPRGRGRGRGGGRGGQNNQNSQNFQQFQQHQQADGDLNMSDTRDNAYRGRGRGYRGGQNFHNNQQHFGNNQQRFQNNQQYSPNNQHYSSDGDQSMRGSNDFQSRGRGRGRGRGNQHYQPPHQRHDDNSEREEAKSDTVLLLERFLTRRYDASNKLLNLTAIATDEEVAKSGMFDSESTQKKFFPALMVICDKMLPERQQKIDAIESVSLSNNGVPNLNAIYELVKYMNHIKNLDLSGNSFANLGAIKPWKNRYKFLEHLIIDPFPEPNWETEMLDWFPKLRILNGKQVRPDPAMPAVPMDETAPANTPMVQMNAPIVPMMDGEQQKKEEMIEFVQRATNLRRDFAIQCLEAGEWNLEKASEMFMQAKATLPPEAYN